MIPVGERELVRSLLELRRLRVIPEEECIKYIDKLLDEQAVEDLPPQATPEQVNSEIMEAKPKRKYTRHTKLRIRAHKWLPTAEREQLHNWVNATLKNAHRPMKVGELVKEYAEFRNVGRLTKPTEHTLNCKIKRVLNKLAIGKTIVKLGHGPYHTTWAWDFQNASRPVAVIEADRRKEDRESAHFEEGKFERTVA